MLQNKSPKSRTLLQRYLPGLPVFALTLALAAQLAHWTWVFIAPEQEFYNRNTAPTEILPAARLITLQHLFGSALPANVVSNDEALSSLRLKGVFAALSSKHSYAILNIGGKTDQTVRIGDVIQPGVTLKNVFPSYIVVNHEGVLKRVNLYQTTTTSPIMQAETTRLGISPVGYNAYRISRDSLSAALQNNAATINLGQLSRASSGGLLVTEASRGSIAEKLGLQTGDILRKVNNQPVSTMADLSNAYQQFKQAPQIQLDLTRSGTQMQLRYNVQQ